MAAFITATVITLYLSQVTQWWIYWWLLHLVKSSACPWHYHPAHRWDHRSPAWDRSAPSRQANMRRYSDSARCRSSAESLAANLSLASLGWGLAYVYRFFLEAIQHLNFDGNLMAIVGLWTDGKSAKVKLCFIHSSWVGHCLVWFPEGTNIWCLIIGQAGVNRCWVGLAAFPCTNWIQTGATRGLQQTRTEWRSFVDWDKIK